MHLFKKSEQNLLSHILRVHLIAGQIETQSVNLLLIYLRDFVVGIEVAGLKFPNQGFLGFFSFFILRERHFFMEAVFYLSPHFIIIQCPL